MKLPILSKIFRPDQLVLTVIISLGILTLIIDAVLYLTLVKKKPIINEFPSRSVSTQQGGVRAQETENIINILLVGHGGPGHSGGSLADTIIVASINTNTKKIALISIPRDTWVSIPVRSDINENHKINMAFAIGESDANYPLKEPQYKGKHGAGNLAKEVVESVIDMPINYYVSINFDGLVNAVDLLGGIAVEVPVTFDDNFYPVKGLENETCGKSAKEIADFHNQFSGFELESQFECRYEQLHFDAGLNQMTGEDALKFVRSRHSATHGGDFARGQRQQALLLAIKDKLFSAGAFSSVPEFYDRFVSSIRTDVDKQLAVSLAVTIGNPKNYTITRIALTDQNVLNNSKSSDGQFILVPRDGIGNWQGVQNYITQELDSN